MKRKPLWVSDDPWTFEQAKLLLGKLSPLLEKAGFACGLTGSVLHVGCSNNDLDLIVFPLNNQRIDGCLRTQALQSAGLERVIDARKLRELWLKVRRSSDLKAVEIWKTPDNKRVDVFLLS